MCCLLRHQSVNVVHRDMRRIGQSAAGSHHAPSHKLSHKTPQAQGKVPNPMPSTHRGYHTGKAGSSSNKSEHDAGSAVGLQQDRRSSGSTASTSGRPLQLYCTPNGEQDCFYKSDRRAQCRSPHRLKNFGGLDRLCAWACSKPLDTNA